MRLPKVLLIDLDDTLICFDGVSKSAWADAIDEVRSSVEQLGVKPVTLAQEIWDYAHWYYSDPGRHQIGRNDLEGTRRLIVRKAFQKLGVQDDVLANTIGDGYSRIREEKLYLFPGVHEALEDIKRRGIPMYMVTNGESHLQRRKIVRFDLKRHFDGIYIEGECGYGKPDERIFRDILERAKVPATEAWIVGDNFEWEIAAPKKLGFTCIWRDKRGEGLPENRAVDPDAAIDQFSEVLTLLDNAE